MFTLEGLKIINPLRNVPKEKNYLCIGQHNKMKKQRIGIACGGFTSEIDISFKSGQVVFETLSNSDMYDCYLIAMRSESWEVRDQNGKTFPLKKDFTFQKNEEFLSFDAVVNMIHGSPGEDGTLAAYLELLGIPQTSCNAYTAGLTYNKRDCLSVAGSLDIPTAKRYSLDQGQPINEDEILDRVGLPCFVKANRAGSSFGVFKVKEASQLTPSIQKAFEEDHQLIIESALMGREVTVGVFEWQGAVKVLPITEIISENDFFDYEAKYLGKSTEITPADLPEQWQTEVEALAKSLYLKLGLSGITRSEFIFHQGIPHLLEINTVPGMTLQSIIPQQLEAAGLSLLETLEEVIHNCLRKKV